MGLVSGYLSCFCKVLLEELDNIPGDSRTQVGFITFDSSVHFYNLGEGLSQPQMLLVSDIEGDTHFPVESPRAVRLLSLLDGTEWSELYFVA